MVHGGGCQVSFSAVFPSLQRKHARRQGFRMAVAAVSAIPEAPSPNKTPAQRPDAAGRFGRFGGRYVPETLMAALAKLEEEYNAIKHDPEFQASNLALCTSTRFIAFACATSPLWTNLDRR